MDDTTINELLDLAEAAEAEGDMTTAREAIAMIESAQRGGPGPRAAPKPTFERPRIPLGIQDERDPTPSMGRLAQQGRSLAAGASRVITGPGQVATAAGQAAGFPGANVARYTEDVNALERQIAGGEVDPGLAMTGNLAAGVAAPLNAVTKAPTMIRTLGKTAAVGATGAATNFNPEATGPGAVGAGVATGAALAPVIPAVIGVPGALRNWFGRLFRYQDPNQAGILAEITDPKFQDFPFSISQRVGTEDARKLEAQIAGQSAKEFYNKQLESLRNRWRDWNAEAKISPQVAAARAGAAIREHDAKLQKAASAAYEVDLNKAMDLARRRNQPIRGQTPRVNAQFEELRNVPDNQWEEILNQFPVKERALIEETFQRTKRSSDMNEVPLQSLITMHRAARTFQEGARRAYKAGNSPTLAQSEMYRRGREIMDAVDADIADLRKTNPQTDAAWEQFEKARADYRQFIKAQEESEASAVVQAFGFPPKDAESAWEGLMRADPKEQTYAINILREHSPDTLIEMKRWKINNVTKNMVSQNERGDLTAVDPARFIAQLTDGSELVGSQFWTAAETARIRSAVATARAIQTAANSQRRTADLEGGTMAVASGAIPFIARQMYRISLADKAERMFFTPQGQKALREAEELMTTGKKMSAAATGWWMSEATEGM